MIRVYYARDGGRHDLYIYGHAGYAEHGQDIVCAGVSAITYALMGFLDRCEEEMEELEGPVMQSGKDYVGCKGTRVIDTAFRMAVIGLEQISTNYPEHVDIQIAAPGG